MPEVLRVETAHWTLSVWTKDILKARKTLEKTLAARNRLLPPAEIRFSPALTVSGATSPAESAPAPPLSRLVLESPVFFENRTYDFEFQFPPACSAQEPQIIHWLSGVEEGFRFSRDCLRGSINFGNDVGWFRLGIRYRVCGREEEQFLSFEVLPVKMDMAADLERIHSTIDASYPLWRFSFARRTEHELSTARKPHERFPLLWLALFRSLRSDLERAVRLICKSPHSRLLPLERFQRPDRLRGRMSSRLEELVTEQVLSGEVHRRHRQETRRLSADTPENRFVKMVLTRCVHELSSFICKARQNNAVPERERLSAAFFEELESWVLPFERLLKQPLFREVGSFAGMAQESMVLQHRAGYAKAYRVWQDLKLYLDLFGRQASVSMKSVEELYEVWCLLEMRRILTGLGFCETESRRALLKEVHFEKQLRNGMGTAFRFSRRDGVKVRLAHEPAFSRPGNEDARGIYSWTTRQVPDILLEASFPDGSRIRWIFDAKYRIDPDEGGEDLIPDDAINQMHRYRDALVHVAAAEDGAAEKSRPVVGAFVLYPGFFDENAGTNPYAASIDNVGIGGFPLLPGHRNLWLQLFLREKFGDLSTKESTERALEPDEHLLYESVRIAPTGLSLARYNNLTLVAELGPAGGREPDYIGRYLNGTAGWYHMPVETAARKIPRTVMRELRYCAVAVHPPAAADREIAYIYDITGIQLVKRCELTAEQAGKEDIANQSEFWLLRLGQARRLDNPVRVPGYRGRFRFLLTSESELWSAAEWRELPERYPSLKG